MKKFLSDLQKELKKLKMSNEEIEEIIADHKEMIQEALEQGVSEEELVLKFGEPGKLAQEMYSDSQRVRVNVNEYVQESMYENIEGYELLKYFQPIDLNEIFIKLISEDLDIYPYDGENIEVHFKKKIKESNYEISMVNGVFKLLRNSIKTTLFERETTPDFIVRYPSNVEINKYKVETISGDIKTVGIEAKDLKLKSTSGDFKVKGIKCDVAHFSTVSGDFEISNVISTEISMSAVSGDFECTNFDISGELNINTVSGDFELDNFSSKHCNVKTVSGDLEGNEFYTDLINLRSVSGDIEITNNDKTRPIKIGGKKTLSGDININ